VSLNYETLNLNALAGNATTCICIDCEKLVHMNQYLLNQVVTGKIKYILAHGHKFKIEPVKTGYPPLRNERSE